MYMYPPYRFHRQLTVAHKAQRIDSSDKTKFLSHKK